MPHTALALDYWWDSNNSIAGFGNTTGTWGTDAYWSTSSAGTAVTTPAVTTASDVVHFGTNTLNYPNGAVGITAAGVTANSIVYGAAQTTGITLGTPGNSLTLAGLVPTITVNHLNVAQTISSPLAGTAGLAKAGAGILALTGANTYTGGSTVNAGTLVFRNTASKSSNGTHSFMADTTMGIGVGGSGFFSTTDLDNAFAGTMTGNLGNVVIHSSTSIGIDTTSSNLTYDTSIGTVSRGLTKLGANTLILTGSNSYTGVTRVAGGTLTVSSLANAGMSSGIGAFADPGAAGIVIAGGSLNYTGTSTTTNRGFTTAGSGTNTITVGAGVSLTLGASVRTDTTASGNGLAITSGAGGNVTISSLTINSGAAQDFNVNATNTNVSIQSLHVTGNNVLVNRGTGMINVVDVVGSSSQGWFGNLNITGTISGYTGAVFLGGDVTLGGLSSFNAPVTLQQGGTYTFNSIRNVNGGASALGNPSTVANGTIGFGPSGASNNPTFRYTGTGDTTDRVLDLRAITGTLTLSQSGTGLLKFTSNLTATGGGSKTLVLTGSTAGTGEIGGVIPNNSGTNITSLSKTGSGRWTLSAANTYSGATTITGGTLALGANNAIPDASAVTIGTATLDAGTFTDVVGALTITGAANIHLGSGATLEFADSSSIAWPGTLNITGTLTGSSIRFGSNGAGITATQLDKITINGAGLGDFTLSSTGYLVYTAAPPDTAPPTPSPMTWEALPAANGTNSITMTATTATDASGVDYYFDETSGNPGGADSGWQSSPSYTNTGLHPSTTYTYTVTARDRSTGQNTTLASAAASATTADPPLYTVWNVQIASQAGNQITTADNFIGAAAENTTNSTWNRVASSPQTGMVLKNSAGENTGVTLNLTSDRQPATQNLNSGPKIFNSYFGSASTRFTLRGLSMTNSYDLIIYSDWWWNSDPLPVRQTSGTGLSGSVHINRVSKPTHGTVAGLNEDTNPANVSSGTGNTGNWYRIRNLTPTLSGDLSFDVAEGDNAPFNGFQLVATPVAPKADIVSLKLPSNPVGMQDGVFSGESGTTVTLTVPYGTPLTALAPTFTLFPGATSSPASGIAQDFTTPQIYTVTSSDSLVTKNYTVGIIVAPPLPEYTLTAPADWDGRSSITVQPSISNLALLQITGGTNFTCQWSVDGVAVITQTSPGVLTLTRSQGSGTLNVTLVLANGTLGVTRSTSINIQEPAIDPWVERSPLPNEKPVAGQFFARNPCTNLGTLYYRGTQSGSPDSVFLKIYQTPSEGSETLYATHRQPLVNGAYDFTATLEAGLFSYRVAYGTTTGGVDTVSASLANLLCGDAYIIQGQSNAQGTDNSEPQIDAGDPWIRTYNAALGWGPAYAKPTSPNWGSKVGFWGMKLGQRIVTDQQLPVCIINGAVGGTRIDQHQPNPANRTLGSGTYDIYANLLNRVIAARLNHGIRGIFWHQGESDCASSGPISPPDHTAYEANFLNMASAWKQDFPNFQRYIVWQVMPNPCGIGPYGDELRDVQRRLPRLFSRMSMLTALGLPGYEGCHYSKTGYEAMGNRIATVVARDFYAINPGSQVTAPKVTRACFTSSARTAISVEFDQAMEWEMFSIVNFHVNNIANQVTSGSTNGRVVTLQLASAVEANSTLAYLKDEWNFNETNPSLLKGVNGLPALSFANLSIDAHSPYHSWSGSRGLSGELAAAHADPDLDGIMNLLEFVLGGEPNPLNQGSNSVNLLPTPSRGSSGDLIFTFRRMLDSIDHVHLNFQWSTDLTFPPANSIPIGADSSFHDGISVMVEAQDAISESVEVTVPATKALNGRLFGRLSATSP